MREFFRRLRDAWRVVVGTRHAVESDRLSLVAGWVVHDLLYEWRGLIPPLDNPESDLKRRRDMVTVVKEKLPAYLLPEVPPIPF